MCDLATEAVFTEAVVVVELDEGLWGVGIWAWEVGELGYFMIFFGFELSEYVECIVL